MAGRDGSSVPSGAQVAAGSEGMPGASFPASERVIGADGLDTLITLLESAGSVVLGPVLSDGAIRRRLVHRSADLPAGWHDDQRPGSYRLVDGGGEELFAYAVGPDSLKSLVFPPAESLWRAGAEGGEDSTFGEPWRRPEQAVAVLGARPCELAALSILDRVLIGGDNPDPGYRARRERLFLVAVECGAPASTCFCVSAGGDPGIDEGYDLALTELTGESDHRFLARAGSPRGAEVLARLEGTAPHDADLEEREELLARSRSSMTRSLPSDVAEVLQRNLDHPHFEDVATRCLSCGNCTMVCPTCFCSDVHDLSDLFGGVERVRRWASCFELSHSELSGGAVRRSIGSRYRQWATHKLSTWHDQFGSSGCVGCGRCITWCPVGIDLTAEVASIAASDVALAPPRRRQAP